MGDCPVNFWRSDRRQEGFGIHRRGKRNSAGGAEYGGVTTFQQSAIPVSLSHPDQDSAHRLTAKIGEGLRRRLDKQFVAVNSVVTNLFTAGPRLVPRNVHVDDDLISLGSIF